MKGAGANRSGLATADHRMHRELAEIWRDVDTDPETRVALIRGEGKGFSGGGDLDLVQDMADHFEVRAGVFLPDSVGLYAVDGATVTQMEQEKAQVHLDKGRAAARIITGVPFISTKQYVEIPGKHAKIRIHASDPEFYFRTADKREPKIALLRTDVQGDKRSLESLNTNVVGQVSYKNHEVSLLQWDAARGLYRFTLEQALEPGEYAMVETTQGEGQSMYVWTFGMDSPAATKGAIPSPAKPASH